MRVRILLYVYIYFVLNKYYYIIILYGGSHASDILHVLMGVSVAKLIIYNIVLLFICHNKRSSSSYGQEIRVRNDFLPHFFCCLSYTYGLRFQVTENVYMYRNKKYVKLSALKTMSPKQRHLP